MCGLTTGNLTNYINRKKVIPSGEYIDDAIAQNRDFLALRQAKKPNVSEPIIPTEAPDLDVSETDEDEREEKASIYELNRQKLRVEIDKKTEEIELLKLRKDKLLGVLIPTDLVTVIMIQHCKSIITEFKNTTDGIITTLIKKHGLNTNEVAELRGSMVQSINSAVNKSIDRTKRNIDSVVNEYSEKKEVGERGPNA